jgi:hypothetical protein
MIQYDITTVMGSPQKAVRPRLQQRLKPHALPQSQLSKSPPLSERRRPVYKQ